MPVDRINLRPHGYRRFKPFFSSGDEVLRPVPPGWELVERVRESNDRGPGIPRLTFSTVDGVITVKGFPPYVDFISVNLPRLITGGGHGGLCKSQQDVDACFAALRLRLDEISDCSEDDARYLVTSIELGWNFLGNLSDVANRARASLHRWVRAEPRRGEFGEVRYGRTRGEFQLGIYAKAAFMKKVGELPVDIPDVFRVEATLSGRKLAEVTGLKNVPLNTLPFDSMCEWLRRCVAPLAFPKAVSYAPRGGLNILALICSEMDSAGTSIHGRRFTDFASAKMTQRTRSRFLKAVHSHIALIDDEWSWSSLFPESGWPRAVELTSRGLLIDGVPYRPPGRE